MTGSRPTAFVIAYTISPYGGSEAGAAWGMVHTILDVADVVVLAPPHETGNLERWLDETGDTRLSYVEVEVPRLARTLKRFQFVPRLAFLVYWMWLLATRTAARQTLKQRPVDVAVHAAYGSYWMPSTVVDIGVPSVWGPVGGATTTPRCLWKYLGLRGLFDEALKYMLVRGHSLLPATRRTWQLATIPLAETENTRRMFPRDRQDAIRVLNRAILQATPARPDVTRQSYLLFPSSLQSRKGPRLALHALAKAQPHTRLVFVADGSQTRSLKRLTRQLGIEDRVEFRGRIPRDEMFRMMAEAAAVVLTGLREEGGCTLSETMQLGTPIIVLGVGGAKLIAQQSSDASRTDIIEPGSDTAINFAAAMNRFCADPHRRTNSYLDRRATEVGLQQAVLDAIGSREQSVEATAPANGDATEEDNYDSVPFCGQSLDDSESLEKAGTGRDICRMGGTT